MTVTIDDEAATLSCAISSCRESFVRHHSAGFTFDVRMIRNLAREIGGWETAWDRSNPNAPDRCHTHMTRTFEETEVRETTVRF